MNATVIDERRQFRILYRSFLFRVIDLELISASGELSNLLAQFASLLAAFNFVLALVTVPHFALSTASRPNLLIGAWGVEEFLISTTITVAGLFAVLAWNATLPDRRDSFVLSPLPLRNRTIFSAKTLAVATALGVSIIGVNIFTGAGLPLIFGVGFVGSLRCLAAYWVTMASAGGFTFIAIVALQNIAAACLSYQLFQRISGLLQISTFFIILTLFFLTPPLANPTGLSLASNQQLLSWLPSFWFLGLFQELNGTALPAFERLSLHAIWNFAAVVLLALASAAIAYRRTIHRVIEQAEIAPVARRGWFSKVASALTAQVLADPIDRATLLFSARTLSRNRQQRLILSVYIGMALAISFAYSKSWLHGASQQVWNKPSVPLLISSLVTLFFAVVGSRAVFALPVALPANWIFRISTIRSPASYFSAVRKSLFLLAALPVLFVSAIAYLSLWPGRPALQHIVVLAILGFLLVHVLLRKFRKIPFACSYLPGKSNLRLKLGIAGFAFLFAVDVGVKLELWSMQKPARYLTVAGLLMMAALWVKQRTKRYADSPYNRIQFEDAVPAEIFALDLRQDAEYINDGDYLDAVSSPPKRPLTTMLMTCGLCLGILLGAGVSYERFGEWRDRERFPQVGTSVNIGGRSLNLYCSGFGSPTVVMDSGGGVPGYGWVLVERSVSKLTRSCWYDRAGYGWSDPSPGPHTAADIAEDLYKLLHSAGVSPPYLLVGHSVGGFNMRVFAARHLNEVAGLVLVDSADEYEDPNRLPESMRGAANSLSKSLRFLLAEGLRLGFHAGLVRLLDDGVAKPDGGLSAHDALIIHTLQLQPKAFDASLNESTMRSETLAQVIAVKSLGSIPLIVLSGAQKPFVELSTADAELLDRFMEHRVHVTQAHLATLSTNGCQIVLPNVGHAIPTQAPDEVVSAVRNLLSDLSSGVKLAKSNLGCEVPPSS